MIWLENGFGWIFDDSSMQIFSESLICLGIPPASVQATGFSWDLSLETEMAIAEHGCCFYFTTISVWILMYVSPAAIPTTKSQVSGSRFSGTVRTQSRLRTQAHDSFTLVGGVTNTQAIQRPITVQGSVHRGIHQKHNPGKNVLTDRGGSYKINLL